MADTFTVLTQREDVEFLGGTQTRNVIAVSIATRPHGTYLEFRIPRKLYSAQQVHNDGTGFAGTVEGVWGVEGVAGMQYGQEPTAGGELQDYFTVTVESSSGESTASLHVPFGQLSAELVGPKVAALRGQLDAAEAV